MKNPTRTASRLGSTQGRTGKLPLDAKLGRELATRINAAYSGRIENVVFTYDPFAESDKIDAACGYFPFNLEHVENLEEVGERMLGFWSP